MATAADGYARASGKAAFLSLYMSTGVMNATSALFMAHRDKIPMVVLATQTESWAVGANARAESAGILELVRPVTKWAWQPTSAGRLQEAIVRAYTIATTPPYGPTFLAIPVDFFSHEVAYQTLPKIKPVELRSTAQNPAPVVEAITRAERRVLLVGGEVVYSGGSRAVQKFAETCQAVVIAEPDPSFIPIDTAHPLYGGELGACPSLVENADLVIQAGVNSLERPYASLLKRGVKRHIHIGHDPLHANEHVVADHYLHGNAAAWLERLADLVGERLPSRAAKSDVSALETIATARSARETANAAVRSLQPISVSRLFTALREALPEDAIVVEHATTGAQLFRKVFHVPDPSTYIASSGSNQGWAIGSCVGVKIANPDRPVVAVVGDGGFMFGVQALQMSVACNAPVIYVVLNNGGWASMVSSVARHAPNVRKNGVDLHYDWSVDFAALAPAMGAEARQVSNAEELAEAIQEALGADRTFLIDVRCSRLQPEFET